MNKTLLLLGLLPLAAQAALKPGDAAPAFEAQAALAGQAQTYQLQAQLAKGPVVVYFYPAAFTGGCNLQARAFAENVERFAAAGVSVVGVSGDPLERLQAFSNDPESCAGKFPVVSDADGRIAKGFDIALSETPSGRNNLKGQAISHARAERSSFVLGRDGKVVAVIGGVAPDANVAAALAAAQQLAPPRTSSGIEVFDTKGTAQGVIELPKAPQNIAFAGTDKKQLYAVGRGAAYRIATLSTGYAGRAK
jgi:thioredoxin-dependent peroxiredoxin